MLSRCGKLPKSVVIFGYRHQIKCVPMSVHGEYDLDRKIIYVNVDRSLEDQRMILFHEIIHAILGVSGISFAMTDEHEEAIVRAVEHGLWPLLQRSWGNTLASSNKEDEDE